MKNIFILTILSLSILSTYAFPLKPRGQDITIYNNLYHRFLKTRSIKPRTSALQEAIRGQTELKRVIFSMSELRDESMKNGHKKAAKVIDSRLRVLTAELVKSSKEVDRLRMVDKYGENYPGSANSYKKETRPKTHDSCKGNLPERPDSCKGENRPKTHDSCKEGSLPERPDSCKGENRPKTHDSCKEGSLPERPDSCKGETGSKLDKNKEKHQRIKLWQDDVPFGREPSNSPSSSRSCSPESQGGWIARLCVVS
jgi:hypothetical protein